MKIVKNVVSISLSLALVAILFYGWGEKQGYAQAKADALKNRHHYVDVLVTQASSPRQFILQPIGMQPWPATSCTPLPWQVGWKLKFADYQQRDDCKDFQQVGSWVCYFDEQGQCLIFNQEIADARN